MDPRSPILPELVETDEGLSNLVDALRQEPRVAVDTESNSLHAYRERVCLMQFSTSTRDYLVDPLALDDLNPLAPIFADPHIEKIFHAAEYDVICLRRDFGYSFANIFDTMQAGRILGRKQAGLDRLLEEKFNVTHNKRFQKADWGVRPLSRELLQYAALDTHYLIPLRDLLQAELEGKHLWPLAQEDFAMTCSGAAAKTKPESTGWSRFKLRRDLTPRELTIVKELLEWRETVAAELDRPPFKVVDDDRLVEIARAKPSTLDELAEAGFGSRQVERWGREVLQVVAAGLTAPLVHRAKGSSPNGVYLKRLDKLKAWRKKRAADMDVESDVVLPRTLLLALAESGPTGAEVIMRGSPWRWQHFGAEIAEVLRLATPQVMAASTWY
jgi:ribonuclease D